MTDTVSLDNTHSDAPISYHFDYEGDSTLIIRLDSPSAAHPDIRINATAIHIAQYINDHLINNQSGIIEALPTFNTIGIYYDLTVLGEHAFETVKQRLQPICEQLITSLTSRTTNHTVEIPICYEFGEDLEDLAQNLGMSIEEIIALHSNTPVRVFMLGFSPGMPYLGLFDNKLNIPRRATPRVKLPAGSVAIANRQCVIYPFETPGGWHIVGRTPLRLFNPDSLPYTPYQPGDMVVFKPISKEEYWVLYHQAHKEQE